MSEIETRQNPAESVADCSGEKAVVEVPAPNTAAAKVEKNLSKDTELSPPRDPAFLVSLTIKNGSEQCLLSLGTSFAGAPILGPVTCSMSHLTAEIKRLSAEYPASYQKFSLEFDEKRKVEEERRQQAAEKAKNKTKPNEKSRQSRLKNAVQKDESAALATPPAAFSEKSPVSQPDKPQQQQLLF